MESNKITADLYISKVDDNEKKIIKDLLSKKIYHETYLTHHSLQGTIRLEGGKENPLPLEGQAIVIDVTYKNWVKKLGSVHNRTEINRMTDLIRRHKKMFYYGNGIYKDELWSRLGHCILKPYTDHFIGTIIINENIGEYPIVIVDFEYKWKKEKFVKEKDKKRRSEEYNKIFKKEKEKDYRRRLNYEYQKFKEKIRIESVENIKIRKKEQIDQMTSNSLPIQQNTRSIMVDDKIKSADARTKIYEIISGRSRKNEKCDHLYLTFDLYRIGFNKYEIRSALGYLEEKGAIYKIIYVDWFISKIYRDISIADLKNELINENIKILIDIFFVIKNFSNRYNYRRGLKKSDLYDEILKKGYKEGEIRNAIKLLEWKKIIYKKSYVYWFSNEYKGVVIKGDTIDTIDDKEDILDKIEANKEEDKEEIREAILNKIEDKHTGENNMDDNINEFAKRINDRYKKWLELKAAKTEERDQLLNRIKQLEQELKDTRTKLEDTENVTNQIKNIENYFLQMIEQEKKVEEKKL